MLRRKNHPDEQRGQSTSETVLLLPLFLLMTLGLLQVGQLVTALLIANYAASAIAREAVQDGTTTPQSGYTTRFKDLSIIGMKQQTVDIVAETGLLANLTVHACAQVDAFPFVGQFLSRPLSIGLGTGTTANCQNLKVFAFSNAAPYSFVVHGKATARMNYRP